MAFTDAEIRAIVKTGKYSDPRAEEWVVKCLIERRDKVGRTYFARVLPLDGFAVRNGKLEFVDLAASYGFSPAHNYSVQWSRFDNGTEQKSALDGRSSFDLPAEVAAAGNETYFMADIGGPDAKKRVTVYLRKRNDRIEVVGVDRTW
jgi:hypothetical protein